MSDLATAVRPAARTRPCNVTSSSSQSANTWFVVDDAASQKDVVFENQKWHCASVIDDGDYDCDWWKWLLMLDEKRMQMEFWRSKEIELKMWHLCSFRFSEPAPQEETSAPLLLLLPICLYHHRLQRTSSGCHKVGPNSLTNFNMITDWLCAWMDTVIQLIV